MTKLKSLKTFMEQNPNVEKSNLKEVMGGKTIAIDTNDVVFHTKDTLDSWNCDDCCSWTVVDGMYGSDC